VTLSHDSEKDWILQEGKPSQYKLSQENTSYRSSNQNVIIITVKGYRLKTSISHTTLSSLGVNNLKEKIRLITKMKLLLGTKKLLIHFF